ncbi:rhodanese-like domain-containing protein [Acidovorax sp. GBBC 3334]|uniref:rhodanese-like domain-containing protein n=1 Tax=unclassified Acidovorax TaxID=2684926 RepID=UPI002303249D|nr:MULTISPECIES: rhodanese-like domain-containing protein [unclassified Acidovorax]MDA8456900.1 rhodanese-like domain-containing protein [Acidovorax sp. GBBC 3334]MDA8520907.1 rhodanese-like domain-containing protein [Acidovorax sp. NCPPB 4044]
MIDHVRPAQLDEWFTADAGGARPLVLDVREPWELQTASIRPAPGGSFDVAAIPMGEIPARLAELEPDRPIACLCHHGVRSLRVAAFLDQQGFQRLANISGGIDAWSQERDAGVARY